MTHYGAVERDDDVRVFQRPGALWIVVDDAVRVAARFAVTTP